MGSSMLIIAKKGHLGYPWWYSLFKNSTFEWSFWI